MKAESAPTFRRAVAFPLPTVEEIEAALDELLAATLKHARERDEADIAARAGGAGEPSSAHGVTADALLETEFLPGEAFIADPIGRSLREGVNMLGKALFALTGSTDVMQEVCLRSRPGQLGTPCRHQVQAMGRHRRLARVTRVTRRQLDERPSRVSSTLKSVGVVIAHDIRLFAAPLEQRGRTDVAKS